MSLSGWQFSVSPRRVGVDPGEYARPLDVEALARGVNMSAGRGKMRWITVGPPDQPGTSIVLHPPAVDPGITDDERRTITEMMAKGTYATAPSAIPPAT